MIVFYKHYKIQRESEHDSPTKECSVVSYRTPDRGALFVYYLVFYFLGHHHIAKIFTQHHHPPEYWSFYQHQDHIHLTVQILRF